VLSWATSSPNLKWHLDRFIRFCTVHGRVTIQRAAPFPLKIAHSRGHLDPYLIHGFLSPPESILSTNGISIDLAVFFRGRQSVSILYNGPPLPSKLLRGSRSHLMHDSLRQSEPITQTASRSLQLFCTAHHRVSLYFTMGCPFPLKIALAHGIWTPSNTRFLGPTRVLNPKGISIGSTVFTGLTTVTGMQTDRQTDGPRYWVGNNRLRLRRPT